MLKHPYASLDGVSLKKLTAANSMFIGDVAFYVVKKNYEGKPFFGYAAYLFPSGISMTFHQNKEELKKKMILRSSVYFE